MYGQSKKILLSCDDRSTLLLAGLVQSLKTKSILTVESSGRR